MSEMNGYEVAEYIRQDKELKDTYLIAVSGFDKSLSKSIDYEDLKDQLKNI